MKTAKCYGRKKTVALERSFVRNFFDGDKSSDFPTDSFKNGHIYSSLDFSGKEERNSPCNVSRSPILFGSSDEENSPSQNGIKVTDQHSSGNITKKSCRVRKEYPRKKKTCSKKSKQIWRGLTKVCARNQPRWSEFFNHNFTVEQQTMKNEAFGSDYDRSCKKISQTPNLPAVNDYPVDISNISCILKEEKEVKRHTSFIQEVQRAKKQNSSMHNVCKNKKKLALNPENILISDTLNSSGDLFISNSDLIKKKRKKNACFRSTNQTKQKFKENNISNLNSVEILEQKIKHCVKSSNISLNFDESFNTSEDLFPAISSVEENISSKVSPYKISMCNQETVPICQHPSLNPIDTPNSNEQMKLSSFSAIHNLSNAVSNLSVSNKIISAFQLSNSKTTEQIIDDKELNESSVGNSINMSKSYKHLESNLMSVNHNSSNAVINLLLKCKTSREPIEISEPVIKDEKPNEYDVVNSIKNSSLPNISPDDAKLAYRLCLDFHPPLSFSNIEDNEHGIQDKSLNDPSANMYTKRIYESLNNNHRGLKPAIISPDLIKILPKINSIEYREGRKILTSTPAVKVKKSSAYSLLHCGNISSLSLKKMNADFASVPKEENLHCSNEILFIDDKVNFVQGNCSSVSTSSEKSLVKKSYSAPRRAKPSKESVLLVQKSNYSDESTKTKLLHLCNQDCVMSFADIYDWSNSKIKKIGEGTYGEVFMLTKKRISCVLKVIPVSECFDDEYQGLQNVLSEVKISKCLSDLRNNKNNQTKNFIKLNRVSLVSGAYPSVLIDAWDSFSAAKSTYNDRPDIFGDEQLFVILELEYGGKDMTCFVVTFITMIWLKMYPFLIRVEIISLKFIEI